MGQERTSLSFAELNALSKVKDPKNTILKQKRDLVLSTPVVDNSIAPAVNTTDIKSAESLKILSWNVERGLHLDSIKKVFTNPDELLKEGKSNLPDKKVAEIQSQMKAMKEADVIVLNEVDVGMPRTGYKDVCKEMAEALHYNYVFAPEFLEVDPCHMNTVPEAKRAKECRWSEERLLYGKDAVKNGIAVDKTKYKGLHGTCTLSKYPLKKTHVVRLPECYDWVDGEKQKISLLEVWKRDVSNAIFKEGVIREIRQGGRMAVVADIDIPGSKAPLTVVGTHLENRAPAACRQKQAKFLNDALSTTSNPAIWAGDFNTMGEDASPTNFKKEIIDKRLADPNFWLKQVIGTLSGLPVLNPTLDLINFARKNRDPTVCDGCVPIYFKNPEKGFFDLMHDYGFDFEGDDAKAKLGLNIVEPQLADTNERYAKGFVPTFQFNRNFGIAKFKLDWIFLKKGSCTYLRPHSAGTFVELNRELGVEFADHAPIMLSLDGLKNCNVPLAQHP